MPVLFCFLSAIWMPESLKFIAVRRPGSPRGIAMAERMSGRKFPSGTVLVVNELVEDGERSEPGLWPKALFIGRLNLITPMLWISKVTILMAYYYTTSWLPTLLGELNVAPHQAATAAMFFQVGGAFGGLLLSYWMDRRGLAAVALFFLLGVPCVSTIGFAAHNMSALYSVTFCSGVCVMGVLYGLNAISAMVYPTAIRTYGAGWAAAIGRLGAIAGPMLGAACLSLGLSIEWTIAVGALPLIAGAASSLGLSRVVDKEEKTRAAIHAT
jgi:AAHS family 4-hydroxybenzoate transporter-like MFS transporter